MRARSMLGLSAAILLVGGAASVAGVHFKRAYAGARGLAPDEAVLTPQTAVAALAKPNKRVYRLQPGIYPPIAITNANAEQGLRIESANPADPAVLTGLRIAKSQKLELRGLTFVGRPGEEPRGRALLSLLGTTDVAVSNSAFVGCPGADGVMPQFYAMLVRDVSRFSVAQSSFSRMRYGIGMLSSQHVTLDRNEFEAMQTDAIRGGGVNDLVVTGNVIGSFFIAPQDHPDGIQLWTANEKAPARNISIRDNLIVRDRGSLFQGIFVRDNREQLPFQNVEFRGNLVVGSIYNGISLQGGDGVRIIDNEVRAYKDQKSWIRINRARGVELGDNRTPIVARDPGSQIAERATKKIPMFSPNDAALAAMIRTWVAARPTIGGSPGPYLTALMRGGRGAPLDNVTRYMLSAAPGAAQVEQLCAVGRG